MTTQVPPRQMKTEPLQPVPTQPEPIQLALAKQIRAMETAGRTAYSGQKNISSGCKELDASLPGGGYSPGTLVEWIDGNGPLAARPSSLSEPMVLAKGSPRHSACNRNNVVLAERREPSGNAPQVLPATKGDSPECLRTTATINSASPETSDYRSGKRFASGQRGAIDRTGFASAGFGSAGFGSASFASASFGSGSFYLALSTARCAMQENNKYIVIIDTQESFYPPAAQFMGISLDRTVVLRPPNFEDSMWAIDQSLRSSAVAAVVARLDKLSELNARRFQLAAEQSGALGLFLRPASARSQPSWSEVQWGVNPRSSFNGSSSVRRIHLQSLRMRGGRSGQHWMLMIDTRTGATTAEKVWEKSDVVSTSSMHLATQLAVPANSRPAIASKQSKRNRAS